MKQIIYILFIAISAVFGVAKGNLILQSLDGDAYEVCKFLSSENDVLNYLNKEMGYEKEITGIERIDRILVNDINDSYYAYLCDFYNDEGYFLLADDYVLLDWVIGEYSPYEFVGENIKFKYYNIGIGYNYINDSANESGEDYNINAKISTYGKEKQNNCFDGQEWKGTGYAKILDPQVWCDYYYEKGYTLKKSKSLKYYAKYDQNDLSCYKNRSSEGNCVIVASYNFLQCLQEKFSDIFTDFPDSKNVVNYNPKVEEKNVYNRYIYEGSDYKLNSKLDFPKLYTVTRKKFATKYNKVESFTNVREKKAIQEILDENGYGGFIIKKADLWNSHTDEVIYRIDNSIPSIFSFGANKYNSYGGNECGHSVCITGYKYYEKSTKKMIFTKKDTILFFEISDGHSKAYNTSINNMPWGLYVQSIDGSTSTAITNMKNGVRYCDMTGYNKANGTGDILYLDELIEYIEWWDLR